MCSVISHKSNRLLYNLVDEFFGLYNLVAKFTNIKRSGEEQISRTFNTGRFPRHVPQVKQKLGLYKT